MKKWLIGIFCFAVCSVAQSQTLADSILYLYEQIELDSLPESERMHYDTNRHYFSEAHHDSIWVNRLTEMISSASEIKTWQKFNALLQRHSSRKLAMDLPEDQQIIYKKSLAAAYGNRGFYYASTGNYQEAIRFRFKSLEIKEDLRDTTGMVSSLQDVGVLYFNTRDLKSAGKFWQQALALQILSGDSTFMVRTLNFLGSLAIKEGNFEDGRKYFIQSLELAQKQEDRSKEAFALHYMGHLYYEVDKYDSAIIYYQKSLDIYQSLGKRASTPDLFFSMYRAAYEAENWDLALVYAKKAMTASEEYGYFRTVMNAKFGLYEIYKRKGNYEKSLEAYESYNTIYDSINNQENDRALYDLQYKFEYEQKAKIDSIQNVADLELEKAQSRQRKTIANFSLAGLAIAILFALLIWNRFSVTRKQKAIIEKDKSLLNEANQKLTSLDHFKTQLFTNISHEIRTPLTIIKGMADQIKQKPDKWLDQGVSMIHQNSNQLLNLVNQILELRKLESGKLTLNLIHNDIIPFLRYILESFHSLAETKDISLQLQAETPSCMMDYDPEKITRIVSNLLANAIKFTPAGGEIQLNIRTFPARENHPHPFLQFVVRDSGPGISTEQLPYIFERFFQANEGPQSAPGSVMHSQGGTGIGLALVRELVHLMNGKIEVESKMGKGTTFTVEIPIESAPDTPKAEPGTETKLSPQTSASANTATPLWASKRFEPNQDLPRILIIEDNQDVVEYLGACLEDFYQIEIARDGQEGIDKATEWVPDLIISDVMMPKKDGFEVCDTLKKDIRTSHIPVILLTAKADFDSRMTGYTRGADAYLTKPFHQGELLIRIKNLLESRLILQERYRQLSPEEDSEDEAIQIEDAFVKELKEIVEKHLDDETFRTPDLCKAIGLSRSQLHNKIKALTGQSTSYFIRQVRLEKGLELLVNTDLQIAEIAYSVGFSTPSYFTRNFTEYFGKSPREMRG